MKYDKLDQDKTRYDLIPPELLEGVGRVLTFGVAKYGARNWESGAEYGRIFAAMMRHLWAWWSGKECDRESGLSHLWHAGACLAFLITYAARGMEEFDDRPNGTLRRPLGLLQRARRWARR